MDRVPIEKQQQRTEQTDQIDIEMNREQTIEAIKVMQAFVDGKTVECKCGSSGWSELIDPVWNFDRFQYRIKPASTLRPWTADEVPLGAWLRSKMYSWKCVIIEVDEQGRIGIHGGNIALDYALQNNEHSTDGGKTWLPCGVMEEAKP
jgi:hypothetical protein